MSALDGFALGIATCGGSVCTALEVTTDAGWSWVPGTGPAVPPGSLDHLRFANQDDGYAYGPQELEATLDGGAQWFRSTYPGEADGAVLLDLEASGDWLVALVSAREGGSLQVSRSPVGRPVWTPIPGATLSGASQGAPDLSVVGGWGFLLSGPSVVGGELSGAWTPHATGCPANLQASERLAADTAESPGWFLLGCSGPEEGASAPKVTMFSTDGGATYQPTGYTSLATPPSTGQLDAMATSDSGAAYMVTTAADTSVYLLDGAEWEALVGSLGPGQQVKDFGFTNVAQGLLVLDSPTSGARAQGELYLTRDAGATWEEVDFSITAPPGQCLVANLSMAAGVQGAALGNTIAQIILQTRGAPCSMEGYPVVTLSGADGYAATTAQPSPSSYIFQARPEIPVVISEGTPASFYLSDTDAPQGDASSCPEFTSLTVSVPGGTMSSSIDLSMCTLPPLVSIVVEGVHGLSAG